MSDTTNIAEQDKVADALKHSWVYRLPKWLWPYAQLARWERPIGWQLLMWPCWWSLMLVSSWQYYDGKRMLIFETTGGLQINTEALYWFGLVHLFYMFLFALGAFVMRGAGCTYNDLVDRDIDIQVARTKSRPLPSGRVNKKGVLVFLVLQLLVGLIILLQFNWHAIYIGIASLITVAIYPFMKRITWWPQLFLGLAFSWGALMGWAALEEIYFFSPLPYFWAPILFYAGCICWVIGYDTIYAHQDIEDDALVGVKSTARLFGKKTRQALIGLYGIALLLFGTSFYFTGVYWPAWVGLLVTAFHMAWQITALDISSPEKCLKLFKSNSQLGLILFAGLTGSALIAGL